MERFLGRLFLHRLVILEAFGPSQFAYTPGRGARDAVLFFVITWLAAFASGRRVTLYCSDVSGAFDKVSTEILLAKLVSTGTHPNVIGVLRSWLGTRTARVVLNGRSSTVIEMSDM
eukprot:2561916-Alexandrium_andersonii.AAC.1